MVTLIALTFSLCTLIVQIKIIRELRLEMRRMHEEFRALRSEVW